jgi:group I intron endonuclease
MENLNCSGIYQITNLINGKIYIGQSIDIHKRWNEHRRLSKRIQQSHIPLNRAIERDGIENFRFDVLEVCEISKLDEKEIYWIEEKKSLAPNGYNLTEGGNGVKGFEMPQIGKDKLRIALTGRIRSKEHSENISKANKGKKRSEEFKRKISERNKGHIKSEETRRKLSEALKGKPKSPEHIEKIKKSKTGHKFTEEQKMIYKKSNRSVELYGIKVNQIDRNTEDIINSFNSCSEAERITGIKRTCIGDCVNGKRKTAGGFIWRSAD